MEIEFKKIPAQSYYYSADKKKYFRPCACLVDNSYAIIDIQKIIKSAKKSKLDFDLYLSTCISHELIHFILTREFNDWISCQFDNLWQLLKKKKSKFHKLGTGL